MPNVTWSGSANFSMELPATPWSLDLLTIPPGMVVGTNKDAILLYSIVVRKSVQTGNPVLSLVNSSATIVNSSTLSVVTPPTPPYGITSPPWIYAGVNGFFEAFGPIDLVLGATLRLRFTGSGDSGTVTGSVVVCILDPPLPLVTIGPFVSQGFSSFDDFSGSSISGSASFGNISSISYFHQDVFGGVAGYAFDLTSPVSSGTQVVVPGGSNFQSFYGPFSIPGDTLFFTLRAQMLTGIIDGTVAFQVRSSNTPIFSTATVRVSVGVGALNTDAICAVFTGLTDTYWWMAFRNTNAGNVNVRGTTDLVVPGVGVAPTFQDTPGWTDVVSIVNGAFFAGISVYDTPPSGGSLSIPYSLTYPNYRGNRAVLSTAYHGTAPRRTSGKVIMVGMP